MNTNPTPAVVRWSLAAALAALASLTFALNTVPDPAGAQPLEMIPEAWASTGLDCDNTDSLAVARVNGRLLAYATAKDGHRLDVLDATTGRFLRQLGHEGSAPGTMRRPNGVAAFDLKLSNDKSRPIIAVVERDHPRVQLLWADTEAPALSFGRKELNRPYGIATLETPTGWRLFITDTEVPPDETVKVFDLTTRDSRPTVIYRHAFGAADGPGRIWTAESIVVDAMNKRLLLCEEDERDRRVKVYTLDGQYAGKRFAGPELVGEPEGIVVTELAGRRCVIVTDQSPELTRWHVYDANDYKHLLSFTGRRLIRRTDGIAIIPPSRPRFPAGGLVAVDDDCQVRAYSLAKIAEHLPD
jgi:3-phytase